MLANIRKRFFFHFVCKWNLHMVESLRDLCRKLCRGIGIPERLIMDGARAQNHPPEVTRVCREFLINVHNSEPENQQQNVAERGGGTVTTGLHRLHFQSKFDIKFWCYASIFSAIVLITCRRDVQWRCLL